MSAPPVAPAAVPTVIYAWVMEGENSFCAALMNGAWMPLVTCDPERASNMRPMAELVAKTMQKRVRLVRFTGGVKMEEVRP